MAYQPREPGFSELHSAKPLPLPIPIDVNLSAAISCKLSREAMVETLGPPTFTGYDSDFGDNIDLWGFEYPCGLKAAFQFGQNIGNGLIFFDAPEIDHVLRHSPFHECDLLPPSAEYLQELLDFFRKIAPHLSPQFEALHAFQVWRIDDNGNVFTVGEPTSERDARCLVAQYEARGHKQMYW